MECEKLIKFWSRLLKILNLGQTRIRVADGWCKFKLFEDPWELAYQSTRELDDKQGLVKPRSSSAW